MKKIKLLLLGITCLSISNQLIGQDVSTKGLLVLGDDIQVENPIETYKNDIRKGKLFNTRMLDLFFAEKIGTAFGGSNNISLQKYFASLDAEDNSFTIGFNFDNRGGDVLKHLNFLFTGGVKMKSENKFSTVFEGNKFQSANVGAMLKFSFIGDGVVNYGKNGTKIRKDAIQKYRELIFKRKKTEIEKFNKESYPKLVETKDSLNESYPNATSVKSALKKKSKEIYKSIAEEEITFLKNEGMYRHIRDWWFSVEAFIPFGNNEYKVTPIINNEATKEKLYGLELSTSLNGFLEWSYGISLFGHLKYSLKGTNNIIINGDDEELFYSGTLNPDNTLNILPGVKAYDTTYDPFVNQSIKFETAVFFFKNTIGISPAIEWNFASIYKATNLKFGIPISLKDKDGKPKVNFELQWKRESTLLETNRIIGVSTSFQFGDLIN